LKYSIKHYSTAFFILFIYLIYSPKIAAQVKEEYIQIAKDLVRSSLVEQKGYGWLKELCEIGSRLSGSENSLKAIRWAEQKMIEHGFNVWLQPVMVPHWERGDIEEAAIVKSDFFKGRELSIMALGGSIGTDINGITAEVIEVSNFDELKKRSNEVKGKIVFFSRPIDPGIVNTFHAYGRAADQRSRGAIEAAKYGAVGVLIRSLTTKYDNVPHTGSMNYVDSLPEIPGAALGFIDADFLSDAIKKDPKLKIKMKLSCKTLPDVLSYNVICDLKGYKKPEEIIVVAGHFDSWDAGCGAHDDGGGCIQALEVLDLFKRLNIKTKRTIRCIFYINEENGVRGGLEYGIYTDTVSSEKHFAAIESDRGVFTPIGFSVTSDSLTLLKLQSWLPVLENAGIKWIKAGGSGVDISKIKNAKALIGFVPDDQRYFDLHHSANDVFEEVHPREMQLGTAAIAMLAYLLSEDF
jgi:carboxypeptidase Q